MPMQATRNPEHLSMSRDSNCSKQIRLAGSSADDRKMGMPVSLPIPASRPRAVRLDLTSATIGYDKFISFLYLTSSVLRADCYRHTPNMTYFRRSAGTNIGTAFLERIPPAKSRFARQLTQWRDRCAAETGGPPFAITRCALPEYRFDGFLR